MRTRRGFLAAAATPFVATLAPRPAESGAAQTPGDASITVASVLGPLHPDALGVTLTHEHVFSRFGTDPTDTPAYDEVALSSTVLPYLAYLRALGVRTIVDATARRFGRHPRLLRDLSLASGVQILTNTGLYGAAEDRYVPAEARTAGAEALADAWTLEARDGIDGTGIRPAFMKVGVDAGPLSAVDRTLVEAGARTHRRTGLLLAVHTGDNSVAVCEQLDILQRHRVSPDAWLWVHASASRDDALLWEVAGRGGWLGFDGLNAETFDRHIALVVEAGRRRLLGRVLLSHDGNSWPAPGRLPRDYDLLLTAGRRRLRDAGLTEDDLTQLLVRNPREALVPRLRSPA